MVFAVHISDGVLHAGWQAAGFGLASVLAFLGGWRLREAEIPRVALLTAAFFISSLIHIPLGPTKVHLLLTGLVGIVLGPRAALAIPIGLSLQFFLFQHGGFWSLGVNACVMGLPALAAWGIFRGLHQLPWWGRPGFRAFLTATCAFLALLGLIGGLTLAVTNFGIPWKEWEVTTSWEWITHPGVLLVVLAISALLGWVERTSQAAPEFTLGFLLGGGAVLLTTTFNYLALILLGNEDRSLQGPAFLQFLVHLPLAPVEGFLVGGVVVFLAKVKPEMLGIVTGGNLGN